ncbi:MAG: hypothetical protein AB1424_01900 [Thermodesulfobacteriota bacterium]
MSLAELTNLEFEYQHRIKELVQKEGGAALLGTELGLRLMTNLKVIQDLKAKKAA